MIEFECPGCNALTKVEDHLAGTEYECGQCQALLEIPTLDEFADQPNASNPTEYVGTPVDEDRPRKPSSTAGIAAEPETVTVGGKPAQCALHPEQAASGICKRCGNFQCNVCSKKGWFKACPSCRKKGDGDDKPFALSRNNYTIGQWLNYSWELFTPNAWPMIGMVVLMMAANFAVSFAFGVLNFAGQASGVIAVIILFQIISTITNTAVQQCLDVGVMDATLEGTSKRKIDITRMFQSFHRFGAVLVAYLGVLLLALIPGLMIGLVAVVAGAAGGKEEGAVAAAIVATLLFGLPYLIFVMMPYYTFVSPHLAKNPKVGGIGALQYALSVSSGHRLMMFLTYFVITLISIPIVIFTCGFGMIPFAGYMNMLRAVMYRTLSNGYEA